MGSRFPVFPPIWSVRDGLVAVPVLGCPGCHSVRIRLAQGCRDENQGGGHRQEPLCPHNPRETLSSTELWWGVAPAGCLAGRAPLPPPFPDTPLPWQEFSGSSPKRRRAEDKDEGIGSPDIWEDEKAEDLRREMIELRQQLDKERSVRMMLEEQVRPGALLQ